MSFDAAIPIHRIFDEGKAREFYLDFLGFSVDWEHRFEPDTPIYLQIRLGDCILHLSEHSGDATPGSTARIPVADLRKFHASLQRKSYKYARPGLEKMPWGLEEMKVADNFGNTLIFYPIEES
ncbi:MAG: glyoxalase superfamily protein [Neomegalonema sp.]